MGGVAELAVARDHDRIGVVELFRGRQMNGVMSPQSVLTRELSSPTHNTFVDVDPVDLFVQLIKSAQRELELSLADAVHARGSREGGSRFCVGDARRDDAR